MRVYTSKNKGKVIANAISTGYKYIWQSPDGVWHAAKNERSLPNWAVSSELVDYSAYLVKRK